MLCVGTDNGGLAALYTTNVHDYSNPVRWMADTDY
jgi:hypothetical protein